MLAFNSLLFPEVMICSAVLAEGVDLYRVCRHVIHHDLCWNPSTLEHRTGRLDCIRRRTEQARRPIVVYEPYLGGRADEKMYRVVRDRERGLQVVMGQPRNRQPPRPDREEEESPAPLPPSWSSTRHPTRPARAGRNSTVSSLFSCGTLAGGNPTVTRHLPDAERTP
jgi:superfamily II DNA/RNA helicase